MTFTNLLNETCEIQEKVETQGNFGQVSNVWTTTQTQACRITTSPQSHRVDDGNYKTFVRKYILFLDLSVIVAKGNRIKQGTELYEVIDVQAYNDNVSQHHKEVYLTKIENK